LPSRPWVSIFSGRWDPPSPPTRSRASISRDVMCELHSQAHFGAHPPVDAESAKEAAPLDENASVGAGVTVRLRVASKFEFESNFGSEPAAAAMALALQAAGEEARRKNAVVTVTVTSPAGDAIRSGGEVCPTKSDVGSAGTERL
jgi:hypothetical protein